MAKKPDSYHPELLKLLTDIKDAHNDDDLRKTVKAKELNILMV